MSTGTARTPLARRLRYLSGWAASGILAAGIVLAAAGPASAHARLVGSSPAAGGSLPATPGAVSLTFDEAVQHSFALVTVTGPDGRRLDTGKPGVSGGTVIQRVAPLPGPGSYRISFRVVSDDGHPVTGSVRFRFAPPATYRPASPQAAVNRSAPPGAATHHTGGSARPGAGWLDRHVSSVVLGVVVAVAGAATVALDRRRRHP